MRNARVLLPMIVLSLVACNGDSGDSTSLTGVSANKPKAAAASKPGPTREQQTAGMVQAASPTRSVAVGDLKFDIRSRPAAGEPVGIELALLPFVESPSVTLELTGSEGLHIQSGDESHDFAEVNRQGVYRKSVTVTPASEGMYFLTVVATFKNADFTDTRTYSIPIIAGPAAAITAGNSAAGPSAASARSAPAPAPIHKQ